MYMFFALLGFALVVASAHFIVESATFIANAIGIPEVVIGATIVAVGTSLPELWTSVAAVRKGYMDLALGNIVGSGFVNITCILGAALLGSDFVDMTAFSNLAMFSVITNLMLWYFLSREKISWREGTILLLMYAMFLAIGF